MALVIPSLAFGGAERQVTLLARELLRQGSRVSVATFAAGGPFRSQLQGVGVPLRVFPQGGGKGLTSLAGLARHLRQARPDLVHSFLWSANFRARLAGLALPGARHIISIRGFDDDLSWYHRLADRLLDRRAHVVVANCQALLDDARRRGIGRRARHLVIYNGIEAGTVHPGGERPPRPTIGFIGRLERKKNPQALVPAMALLARRFPELEVVVVGGGSLEDDLKRRIAQAGLAHVFRLVGYQQDVADWYSRIHVLVNTSLSEGCCNVILEAMRAGLPVVATAVGGNVETVRDGQTGLLVPEGDADALAAACGRLLSAPDLSRTMGAAGRARLEAEFSLAAMAGAYLRLYGSLMEEG